MADQLKTFFSPPLVRRLAGTIARVHPAFPTRAFTRDATRGLEALELLDRGRHISRALAAHLPPSYPDAVAVLLASLGPAHDGDENLGAGMAPFFYLPYVLFIAEHGLDHFDLSMRAQYEVTQRLSAEFSIRHFIAHDPERALAQLLRWTTEPNPHVRRLVSEGTRLRLPWAIRVRWLDDHPERVVELLELLRDDPSPMVRRSVANSLNDIGRVRPDLLVRIVGKWLPGATDARRDLIRHATRGAVKRGDRGILRFARLRPGTEGVSSVSDVQPLARAHRRTRRRDLRAREHGGPPAATARRSRGPLREGPGADRHHGAEGRPAHPRRARPR